MHLLPFSLINMINDVGNSLLSMLTYTALLKFCFIDLR